MLCIIGISCKKNPLEPDVVMTRADKDTMILGSAVNLYTLDPAIGFDQAISCSLKNLYDSLFKHTGNPPRPIPWLVESYQVSPDAREWTFKLVEDAYFHDGTPVTADAVKYSVGRLMHFDQGPAGLFKGIIDNESVTVIDDYNLVITLLKPFGPFLDILPWLFIINPRQLEFNLGDDNGQSWLLDHEAGSGPFSLGEWIPGESYEFIAVDNYWKGWPSDRYIRRYIHKVIKNADERIAALRNGEVDIIDWIAGDKQLELKNEGFFIEEMPGNEVYEIKFNTQKGYTADVHVRRAISYAFDYKALQDIWAGRAPLAQGPLPTNQLLTEKEYNRYYHNLEKAKKELALSAWPYGGFTLDFVYVTGLEEEQQTGEILKKNLMPLNINVNIIPMTWSDAVASFNNVQTSPSMFPLYSLNAYPDPDNYLFAGYHSSFAGNWTNPGHYKSETMDRLLQQARETLDEQMRRSYYKKAVKLAIDDAVNIFGVTVPSAFVYSPAIAGHTHCPVAGSEVDFYYLYFSDDKGE